MVAPQARRVPLLCLRSAPRPTYPTHKGCGFPACRRQCVLSKNFGHYRPDTIPPLVSQGISGIPRRSQKESRRNLATTTCTATFPGSHEPSMKGPRGTQKNRHTKSRRTYMFMSFPGFPLPLLFQDFLYLHASFDAFCVCAVSPFLKVCRLLGRVRRGREIARARPARSTPRHEERTHTHTQPRPLSAG